MYQFQFRFRTQIRFLAVIQVWARARIRVWVSNPGTVPVPGPGPNPVRALIRVWVLGPSSGPGARFSEASETFWARQPFFFSSSVSKNGETQATETSCMMRTYLHDDTYLRMYRCFTGCIATKNWRENQENLVSNLEIRSLFQSSLIFSLALLSPSSTTESLEQARKSADRCSLKVGHSGCY